MQEDGLALIVEDNVETLSWLRTCVESAFPDLNIDTAETFTAASSLAASKQFNLALVDLGLPDGSGLDLIKKLRVTSPDCHIVVATIYDDDANLFTALRSGAKGYILKDQDHNKIISYLQGIRQQKPAISAASSQRLIDHFNNVGSGLEAVQLTPRETDVTRLIAKGYSVEESADLLNLSPDTVKGHIKNIYQKLGVNNRSELTLSAVKLGLVD